MPARFSRSILLSAIALDSIGTGLFAPLTLLYFVTLTPLPITAVGALTTVGVLLSLPVPIVAGALADRFGPRALVVTGQLTQAVGFTGYLTARDGVSVAVVIGLVAVGQRIFWSTFFTLVASISDRSGPDPTERRFALVGMMQAGGIGVGSLVAGLAIGTGSDRIYPIVAATNAASFALSAGLLLLVQVQGRPHTRSIVDNAAGFRALRRDRIFITLVVSNVPLAMCSVLLGTALPIHVVKGIGAPGWIVGPLLAANTVALAGAQLGAVRLARRWRRTSILVTTGLLWTLWCGLMCFTLAVRWPTTAYLLAASVAVFAVAEVLHAPVSNALSAEVAPEVHRGSYLAAFQYGFTVATLIVPGGFAWLFTADPRLPWAAAASLALLACLGLRWVGRQLPERVNRGAPLSTDVSGP